VLQRRAAYDNDGGVVPSSFRSNHVTTSAQDSMIDSRPVDLSPWFGFGDGVKVCAVGSQGASEGQSYIDSQPGLRALTEKVCKAARQEFGPDASLTLQVRRGPQADDVYLSLYVRLPSYGPDTMERIQALMGPFEDEIYQTPGWLVVSTDFRPTR